MRTELLVHSAPECPLLRLFDFTAADIALLQSAFVDLANGRAERMALREIVASQRKDEAELWFAAADCDEGTRTIDERNFEYALTGLAWDNNAGLLDPFVAGKRGFQWLEQGSSGIAALLSSDGRW